MEDFELSATNRVKLCSLLTKMIKLEKELNSVNKQIGNIFGGETKARIDNECNTTEVRIDRKSKQIEELKISLVG